VRFLLYSGVTIDVTALIRMFAKRLTTKTTIPKGEY